MKNLRIDLTAKPIMGQNVTFVAPCDCTEIGIINVYYPDGGEKVSELYHMADCHLNHLSQVGNLFVKGAHVSASLDTERHMAYLLNADTNAYLEQRLSDLDSKIIFSTEEPTEIEVGKIVMVYE